MRLQNKAKDPTDAVFAIGSDGSIIHHCISEAPHMLVAGTTGSGKSVTLNVMLSSMLVHSHPDDLKLMIIDPKRVEFGNYKDLPHMLANPITDMKHAQQALEFLADEMDRRYTLLEENGVKKLPDYNELAQRDDNDLEPLPYIVLLCDEFADLIKTVKNPKDVEDPIQRLGQKARAAGVHVILATQSPRREVITGIIKANIPSTVCMMVGSNNESMIALGETGGEKLKPRGDMLISFNNEPLVRGQAPFIRDDRLEAIFKELRERFDPPNLMSFGNEENENPEDMETTEEGAKRYAEQSKQQSRKDRAKEELKKGDKKISRKLSAKEIQQNIKKNRQKAKDKSSQPKTKPKQKQSSNLSSRLGI